MPNIFSDCRNEPSDLATAWLVREPIPGMPGAYRVLGECPPVDGDYREFVGVAVQTRDILRSWFDRGALLYFRGDTRFPPPDWSVMPHIKWLPYDFWVPTGVDMSLPPDQQQVGVCAAGLADYQYNQIVVSYRRSERVAALVCWETANYWLCKCGRQDWADRHGFQVDGSNALVADAGYVAKPKRRVAGRRK